MANRPEGGACFTVVLPRGAAHLGPDDIALEPLPGALDGDAVLLQPAPLAPTPSPLGELPLALVVEDNPDMQAYLAAHLAAAFTVARVDHGRAALDWLAGGGRPAVEVSDVMMPELDGLGLCRALRADPQLAGVPVLRLSAKATPEDRLDGLGLADDCLTKPFRAAEMVLRARKLAERSAARQAGGPFASPDPGVPPAAEPSPPPRVDPIYGKLVTLARDHMADPDFGVEQLARAAAVSPRQLLRRMKTLRGQTATAWLREQRLEEARRLLRSGSVETVGEAAAAVGFTPASLSRVYRDWAGHPPSAELAGRTDPRSA